MSERDVFTAAREITDPVARAAYLDRECGGDAGLRARVETLLRAYDQPDSLLDHPVVAQHVPDSGTTRTIGRDGGAATEGDVPLGFLAPSTRPDSLGRIGHYEVLEVLGRGGFGIVFRAFDNVLHRVVAVKVLSPQLAATSPARKRFLREARSSAQVRHENVVQVYEVGEQPLPYIAMEFIPGETLQQRLDRTGPVEPAEVVRVGRQIAEGLAAAHATELIHRDIKPGNVLLEGGSQRVKITDFGLARAADDASISQSGIIAGTPMYMAPEQAKGETLDQRADLFSLGSVLYQMAAGRPPFRANGTLAVLKRVAEDAPRPIREVIPETPQWLCDIIAKLHAKDPDERFQSAREVADVLADCETQLNAHAGIKDFSRIPGGKPQRFTPGRLFPNLRWFALAWVILFLVVPVAMLVRRQINAPQFGFLHLEGVASEDAIEFERAGDSWGFKAGEEGVALTRGGDQFRIVTFLSPKKGKAGSILWEAVAGSYSMSVRRADGSTHTTPITLIPNEQLEYRLPPATPGGAAPSDAGDWVQLFNGKDLTGWKAAAKGDGAWEVTSAGYLRGFGKLSHLASQRDDYGNFHLRIEARINSGGYAGVAIRSESFNPGREGFARGYNAVVNSNNSQATGRTGSLARMADPGKGVYEVVVRDMLVAPDRWFTLEVHAEANKIVLKVEDRVVATFTDREPLLARGQVGLTLGPIRAPTELLVRKIEIKELPPSPPPAKSENLPPTFKNGLGMEFVIVPKGKSWLGGGKDKLGDKEVDIPADFYLGKYEVTQEEWEKVMGENPSWFSRTGNGKEAVKDIPDADLKRFPVESVSWDQCQVFVAKLNQREKESDWVYRLPTEVEWEYACRGGPMADKADSAYDFYFANPTNALLPEQANYNHVNGLKRTCKVGMYEANPLGLHDLHGNIWEWCHDIEKAADRATRRVFRGGSFNDIAGACTATGRPWNWPERNECMGLRLARVREASPPSQPIGGRP